MPHLSLSLSLSFTWDVNLKFQSAFPQRYILMNSNMLFWYLYCIKPYSQNFKECIQLRQAFYVIFEKRVGKMYHFPICSISMHKRWVIKSFIDASVYRIIDICIFIDAIVYRIIDICIFINSLSRWLDNYVTIISIILWGFNNDENSLIF